jgi:hypothetical protein
MQIGLIWDGKTFCVKSLSSASLITISSLPRLYYMQKHPKGCFLKPVIAAKLKEKLRATAKSSTHLKSTDGRHFSQSSTSRPSGSSIQINFPNSLGNLTSLVVLLESNYHSRPTFYFNLQHFAVPFFYYLEIPSSPKYPSKTFYYSIQLHSVIRFFAIIFLLSCYVLHLSCWRSDAGSLATTSW